MAYIYIITNDINDKVYVGKTQLSLRERFQQHKKDCKKLKNANRPLYKAMNKHGVEHFRIKLIEETDEPAVRERFWIDYYDAYYNGYNATYGGDGKTRIDHNAVVDVYLKRKNVQETAEICKVSADHVPTILRSYNIQIKDSHLILKEKYGKTVGMFDVESYGPIKQFQSTHDAAKYLKERFNLKSTPTSIASHIADVCNGKRHSVCGFNWKYL